MKTGKCKACKADIIWVKTLKGKWMILDAKKEIMWQIIDGTCHPVNCHIAHWATCPDAESFKK